MIDELMVQMIRKWFKEIIIKISGKKSKETWEICKDEWMLKIITLIPGNLDTKSKKLLRQLMWDMWRELRDIRHGKTQEAILIIWEAVGGSAIELKVTAAASTMCSRRLHNSRHRGKPDMRRVAGRDEDGNDIDVHGRRVMVYEKYETIDLQGRLDLVNEQEAQATATVNSRERERIETLSQFGVDLGQLALVRQH